MDTNTNKIANEGFQYDAAGPLPRFHRGGEAPNLTNDGFSTYTWNAEGRMASTAGVTYTYDGEGRRVRHRHQVYSGGSYNTTKTTLYVYDAFGQLAAEYGDSTTNSDCTTCYLTPDPLGSTRLITDQLGNAVARYDFLPFGQEILPPPSGGRADVTGYGETDAIRHKFTAKERDSETGLDYFGARYFSSAGGRFTSPDPSPAGINPLDPQSWNLYSYVRNRPMSFADNGGLWSYGVHRDILTVALSGYVSAGELRQLIKKQWDMDWGEGSQGPEKAFQHAMRNPNSSVGESQKQVSDFITAQLHLAAAGDLGAFGAALHTVADLTSPRHTTAVGEPIVWRGLVRENVQTIPHYFGENSPSDDWSGFAQAVRLTLGLTILRDPALAMEKGLTWDNVDAIATARISRYIDSFYNQRYLATRGQILGLETEREAARQCALYNNRAACH